MPKMKALIEAGLFGRGLIEITDSVLVERYNRALQHLGLLPTTLHSFRIDRLGWSPEVAAEKDDDYYLSHGEANPLGIILTPDQEHAPIYFPMHSFDWRLTGEWFRARRAQIVELTKETAVCIDFDQEVDFYQVSSDLTMVNDVVVKTTTPCGIMKAAKEQVGLVHRWLKGPDAHLDGKLIAALEESAKMQGDLRGRSMVIHDLHYSDVKDFYSRVFGGTFVLRSKGGPLIFTRENKWVDNKQVFLANGDIVPKLIEARYVYADIDWWKNNLYRLGIVAESFLVDVVDEAEPDLDWSTLSPASLKGLMRKYRDRLPHVPELARLRASLADNVVPEVSEELRTHLVHPSHTLSEHSEEVVWQLLTYINGGRLVPLFYRHQKTVFVKAFTETWNNPKRTWALQRISEFYHLASKSGGALPK